jgi:hypothetical protein
VAGIVRDLDISVQFNGSTLSQVLSFHWALGYDMQVGEATVVLPVKSTAGTYYDDVVIFVEGSPRWAGMLVQWDYALFPRAVTMQCKGKLARAQQYKLPEEVVSAEDKGMLLETLMAGATATDDAIVSQVLAVAQVGTNGGSINGTGRVLGTIAPEEYIWRATESALDYIQKIDAVSAGYRTFESTGGQVYRSQISSRPSGSIDMTFTEGEDISEGSSNRTVQEAYSAVRIGGYSVGDYFEPRVWFQAEGNDFQEPEARVYSWDNSMIERRAESSTGEGMSCEAMAEYWLGELNREVVKVTMTTPRTDEIGPGQIHLVQGPGGAADRLGVGEPLWVQRVEGTLTSNGAFSQSVSYIGGGI